MRKLLLFTWLCIAQMAAGQRTGETVFKTLGIADGLRSNAVTSLLADSRGYLWIGTYQGINRYDGTLWIFLCRDDGCRGGHGSYRIPTETIR